LEKKAILFVAFLLSLLFNSEVAENSFLRNEVKRQSNCMASHSNNNTLHIRHEDKLKSHVKHLFVLVFLTSSCTTHILRHRLHTIYKYMLLLRILQTTRRLIVSNYVSLMPCLISDLQNLADRAIAQAVSYQVSTAAARVRSQVTSCGICGRHSGTGAGFLRVFLFPQPILILTNAQYSSVIRVWYKRSI
jgi:hypothetical protein